MGVYSEAAARLIMPTDDNPMGLLEFSVRAQSADTAMFESMLEMDFAEYYSESGQIVLSEKETTDNTSTGIKAVFQKIAELFQKAWNALSQFVTRITGKITDAFKLNDKLLKKYENVSLEEAQAKDPEKKVFRIKNYGNKVFNDSSLKDVREKVTRAFNLVKPDNKDNLSTDTANAKKEELNNAIDKLTSSEHFNAQFEETSIKNLGPGSVSNYKEFLTEGSKALINSIVKDAQTDMKVYKEARQAALKAAANAKLSDERESAAAKFSLASTIVGVNSKYINYASRLVFQAIGYARKSLIAIGVAAERKEAKKAKEATGESVVYDDYLELALEFATDNFIEETTFA